MNDQSSIIGDVNLISTKINYLKVLLNILIFFRRESRYLYKALFSLDIGVLKLVYIVSFLSIIEYTYSRNINKVLRVLSKRRL